MIRSGRDFWMFQATFWVLAAVALFLYGLTYGHVQVALVCSLYNPLVGFGYSYLIKAVYDSRFPPGFGGRVRPRNGRSTPPQLDWLERTFCAQARHAGVGYCG